MASFGKLHINHSLNLGHSAKELGVEKGIIPSGMGVVEGV